MGLDVRTITDAEVAAWSAALNTGFLNPAGDVDADARRPGLELDRTWAGFDGDRVVSTLRTFPAELTVPGGGRLDTSAVTAVTTTSTHRRRGLAARMVTAELAAAAERGEHASILIAAEWGIYGRFGYGPGTEHQTVTVDARVARLRQQPSGTVEYVDRETARAVAPAIFERHRAARVGEMSRTERYWDFDFDIVRLPSRPEPKPSLHVLARDPAGTPIGLARYEYADKWEHRLSQSEVSTQMLVTAEPAAEALLWHHLISLDWATTVRADDRPPDELVPWLLTDARHARLSDRADFLWIRPLDVPAMLSARSYLAPGRVVLEVVDKAGFGAGRFALDAGPDGASCRPTDASADLTLDAGTLGSVYLGGYRLRQYATVGLVDEHTPGAAARADTMFRTTTVPWCSTWF